MGGSLQIHYKHIFVQYSSIFALKGQLYTMKSTTTQKESKKLDEIYDLIWVDTEQAWVEALRALDKYKGNKLNYASARAQLIVCIISAIIRSPLRDTIDAYELKSYFEANNLPEYGSMATLWMIRTKMFGGQIDEANVLDAEYEQKYAKEANAEQKASRILLKGHFNMMRNLNKTDQVGLALEAETLLRASASGDAHYRIDLANALQLKAEALSHTGEVDMVKAAMDEAIALVDVPGTSPFFSFSTYYFKGNVAAVARRTDEALACYYLLEKRFAGKSFYDSLLIYVYIQIFKQLNDRFSGSGLSAEQKKELIAGQEKYLDLAKSLLATQRRPYMIHYLQLSEARLMRARGQYRKAITELARALPYFAKNNYNNHIIDIYEEAYDTYRLWAEEEQSPILYRKALRRLQRVNNLNFRYNQTEGKERMDALINKYELQQKELNEKLLHQKIQAMNKEIQLTALNLHEKVTVLDELKSYVTSLHKKGQETNHLIRIIAQKIDTVIITEQEKSTLQQKIDETNTDFFKILSEKYPKLSSLECRMAGLFKTGMTNKELSKLYGQSEKSYEQHRYRIKKKMGLGAKDNLVKFLSAMPLGEDAP